MKALLLWNTLPSLNEKWSFVYHPLSKSTIRVILQWMGYWKNDYYLIANRSSFYNIILFFYQGFPDEESKKSPDENNGEEGEGGDQGAVTSEQDEDYKLETEEQGEPIKPKTDE